MVNSKEVSLWIMLGSSLTIGGFYLLGPAIENLIDSYKQQSQDEQLAKMWGSGIHEDAPAPPLLPLKNYFPPLE